MFLILIPCRFIIRQWFRVASYIRIRRSESEAAERDRIRHEREVERLKSDLRLKDEIIKDQVKIINMHRANTEWNTKTFIRRGQDAEIGPQVVN